MRASRVEPDAGLSPRPFPLERSARFDRTRRYRYGLTRRWVPRVDPVLFVLLNPSTADAERDDPTIRRCMGFARDWGHGAVEVANLFAWRATRPSDLRRAPAPVGPRNDRHLRAAARTAARVVLAWGIHGSLHGRDAAVLKLLEDCGRDVECLGLTQGGQPRHVLYLPRDTELRPYAPPG